jgi:galactonate dehydratase
MKIKSYRTEVIATPWRNLTLLILETECGLEGYGEARVVGKTHTVTEYLKDVKRHIIGHEVYDIEDLYQRLTLLDFGVGGEVVMTGLALVEMACWDLIGKKANLPVYKLLGGKVREKIPVYANGWYTGERSVQAFYEAAKKVVSAGYSALKFDPFGNGNLELTRQEYKKSIEIIEAVNEAVGSSAQMLIEMHGRFSPQQAVEIAKDIERFKPGWIEEPCRPNDIGALKYVMDHTCIPIACGERLYSAPQFRELFDTRAAHIIQPDINQCGGFLEVKKICSTAETYSIMVAPHNVGGIISTTAAIHLMATLRNGKILEHFNDFSDSQIKECGTPYPKVVDGHVELPTRPGWGVELNFDFIKNNPPKTADGVILDPGLNMFVNSEWNKRKGG